MTYLSRYSAALAAVVGLAYLASGAVPRRSAADQFDLAAFGTIPVVDGGRVKPLETAARTNLMVISAGKQTYRSKPYREKDSEDLPATKWLLDVWSNLTPFEGPATKHQVVRVENEQLLNLLALELRPEFYRYSPAEIHKRYGKFEREVSRVRKLDAKTRDPYEQMVMEVGRRLSVYQDLVRRETPLVVPPTSDGDDWRSLADVDDRATDGLAARLRNHLIETVREKITKEKRQLSEDEVADLLESIDKKVTEEVRTAAARARPAASPAAAAFVGIIDAYARGDAAGFNSAVADYKANHLGRISTGDQRRVGFEAFFNRFDPFHRCLVLYVAVFALGALSWTGRGGGAWDRAAMALSVVAVVTHSLALVARMYIQGRPPVTNLYSSAVFIGWGCVLLGIGLQTIYRNGVGVALSGVTGFLTLLIADSLGTSGDTLEMMQAVLDTNFWLATHVTVVTLGYTATYVAGFLAIRSILQGLFTTTLTPAAQKELSQMTYGVICFATLLSFVGTVLGGIWADQSWGRFWGWDPKENGALLVVVWNALILHARWGGMIKQRGLAVLAVLGNVVATWSWFGTNQLGVGLHAYGFRNDIALWVLISSCAFTAIAGLGMLPVSVWRSHAANAAVSGKRRKEAVHA